MEQAETPRVCVASFSSEFEAQMVCQMLASEGLNPKVAGAPLLGLGNYGVGAAGSFEVSVPQAEVPAAMQLLSEAEREHRPEIPESVSPEEVAEACPECGGNDKAYEALTARNRYARSQSSSWPFVEPYTWRCTECGHLW